MKIINTFSKDEEIANAVSHMVGATLALISAVVLIMHGIKTKSPIVITSFAIFGAGLVIMYTVSSIYHALHNNKAKQVFQILDHSAIYILIAASYTPCLLLVVKSKAGYIIFSVVSFLYVFILYFSYNG